MGRGRHSALRFRLMPWWVRIAAALAGVCALLIALLWTFQRRLIYQRDTAPVGPAAAALTGGVDAVLRTADGLALRAWYVPAQGVAPQSGGVDMGYPAGSPSGQPLRSSFLRSDCRPTVLIAPGNAGNRTGRIPLARAFVARGFGVLLLDYRGYGGNPGRPSEDGLTADAEAAYQYLTDEQDVPNTELIYYGESLGAAVVTRLAQDHPPAALVLRSPFTDLAAAAGVAFPFLPVRQLLRDDWPLSATLSRLAVPTTVIYGTADTVIPAELSMEVADLAGNLAALVPVPGADHNDGLLVNGPLVIEAVVAAAQRMSC